MTLHLIAIGMIETTGRIVVTVAIIITIIEIGVASVRTGVIKLPGLIRIVIDIEAGVVMTDADARERHNIELR